MSTGILEHTDTYLRTVCPSNRRSALQGVIYETADVIDDQLVERMDGNFNVVVTRHESEFAANHQSSRINAAGGFTAEVFDTMEAAMAMPPVLEKNVKSVLPHLSNRSADTQNGLCGLMVESAGAPCKLKALHRGNCRTK
jgi:hypothetical protein